MSKQILFKNILFPECWVKNEFGSKKCVAKRMLCQKRLDPNTCWSKVNFGSQKLQVQGFASETNFGSKKC